MASVVTRTLKDGTRAYDVKYRDGARKQQWERVPGGKRAANARRREIEDNLLQTGGRWTPPAPVKCRIASDEWLEQIRHDIGERVHGNYARSMRLVWNPAFGELDVAAITWAHVDDTIAKRLNDGKAKNTVRNDVTALRLMLAYTFKKHRITSPNPAVGHRIEVLGARSSRRRTRRSRR
jgi:hypothetical protein